MKKWFRSKRRECGSNTTNAIPISPPSSTSTLNRKEDCHEMSEHESSWSSFQSATGKITSSHRQDKTQSTFDSAGVNHSSSRRMKATSIEDTSLSYSHDSSRHSKETMSMGSTLPQDSFVVVSTTGLSSVDHSSVDSFRGDLYCRERKEFRANNHCDSSQQGYTNNRTTNHLPRLTVASLHRQAYLEKKSTPVERNSVDQVPIKNMSLEPIETSLHSSNTKDTDPSTPLADLSSENNQQSKSEFPGLSSDETPQLQISVDSSNEGNRMNGKVFDISASKYDTTYVSQNESSMRSAVNVTEDFMKRDNQSHQNAITEKEFWTIKVQETIAIHGDGSFEIVRQLNNLGSSLMRCNEYAEAMSVYERMIVILKNHCKDDSLVFARALDKIGLAASMKSSRQNLDWALLALREALHLRLSHLGPHHLDTIDTLNNIAGVYLRMREWSHAKECYVDVLTVRAAVFGLNHPSVAVTAQTLGRVCSHLSDFQSALQYYKTALSIYREEPTMLKDNHPIMKKIFRNIDRTERLLMSLSSR